MPPTQSKREQILEYMRGTVFPLIVAGGSYNMTVKTIERGWRTPTELGLENFPAIFMPSSEEETKNHNQYEFESLMDIVIVGYVNNSKASLNAAGTGIQKDLGNFIADVRTALEADPLFNNLIKYLEITKVTTDNGDLTPLAGFVLSVRVEYIANRQTQC